MAGNELLMAVRERGRLQGLGLLTSTGRRRVWKGWGWILQALIWAAIVNGMLAAVLFAPVPEEAQEQMGLVDPQELVDMALLLLYTIGTMAPAVGAVIMGQDEIIGERQSGTAAWVLSKPITRGAFVLSKLAFHLPFILTVMVVIPAGLAYLEIYMRTGIALDPLRFVAAEGLVYLVLVFYFTLCLMLGTLFRARGAVIGIPLFLIFGFQIFTGLGQWVASVGPWNLTMDLGPGRSSLAMLVMAGQPLPTVLPIVLTAVWCLVFVAVALWRFEREEF